MTIFGCGGSEVIGRFVETLPGPYGTKGSFDDWQLCEWVNLCRGVEQSAQLDVLHSHAYLWGIPLEKWSRAPLVHTLHIVPDDNTVNLWSRSPGSNVTAISEHQWSAYPHLSKVSSVANSIMVKYAGRGHIVNRNTEQATVAIRQPTQNRPERRRVIR